MKLFISWSGDLSNKLAEILRDWLPSVIQIIDPFLSSEDIEKGSRWSIEIASNLEATSVGIVCVTPGNINSSWLNFESGALSKFIDKSYVCPILFQLNPVDIKGPLLQFQLTRCEKDDIKRLTSTINSACGEQKIEDQRLEKIFEVWWPKLKEELEELESIAEDFLPRAEKKEDDKEQIKTGDFFQEILERMRVQREMLEELKDRTKILDKPELILPEGYFKYLFRDLVPTDRSLEDIRILIGEIGVFIRKYFQQYEKEEKIPISVLKDIDEYVYSTYKKISSHRIDDF